MTDNEGASRALAADLAQVVTAEGGTRDDRRAAIDAAVQRALGRFADRATITPEELAEVMGWGRSTSYDACRAGGTVPSVRVGRRVLVPVPGLVAVLLGAAANGADQ